MCHFAGASAITASVIDNADHSFSTKRIELAVAVASWLAMVTIWEEPEFDDRHKYISLSMC